MSRRAEALPGNFQPYVPSLFMMLIALPVGVKSGVFFGSGVFLVGCISFLFTRDLIGKTKKAHEQQRLLGEQLIQSQKLASIGELSAGIAHEINNPLAIIGQEAEWLSHLLKADSLQSPEIQDSRESLREITRQVDRCKDITHKLLNFARRMEPVIQPVDINRLIEDMARLVEKEARLNNIELVRQYGDDLPPLFSDPPQLRQVILNLLNNATYATGQGGSITITTRVTEDHFFEIAISDTGCGIPGEHLSRIFDPFFTTKPPGKGTGLGLSICHRIIESLGGHMAVTSEKGKGATFFVYLPSYKE